MLSSGSGAILSAVFCRSADTATHAKTGRNFCAPTDRNGLSPVQGVTHVRNEIQRDYLIAQHHIKDEKEYGELSWRAMAGDDSYGSIRLLEGSDIIDAVHDAGGIVLIAHPAGYFKGRNEARMDEIFEALKLDGIECAHPSVPEENTNFYRAYCRKHRLLSSGGTDCHEDPPHAYLKLSPGRDMAFHAGAPEWLDEILERVRLWNV